MESLAHYCRRKSGARLKAGTSSYSDEFKRDAVHQITLRGIWWIGLRMSRSGSEVEILQVYSYGVRPLSVSSLRAMLYAAM